MQALRASLEKKGGAAAAKHAEGEVKARTRKPAKRAHAAEPRTRKSAKK